MKIITYNVNGVRSAISKGLAEWAKATNADIICLQEIKASLDVDLSMFHDLGYKTWLFPAEKKGYSGTAIFSKVAPNHVEVGSGMEAYDREGRIIRADFNSFSVMCVYMPSGSSGEDRQAFKFKWMDDFLPYALEVKKKHPNLIICGDYNICHKAIDIHNPKSNAKTSGFLPEEREWVQKFLDNGFVDVFRHLYPEKVQYTWWTYRLNARTRGIGWRLDYFLVSEALVPRVKDVIIHDNVMGSDHCPVELVLD